MKVSPWKVLFLVSISELFALSLWFSATAILPSLRVEWDLDPFLESWVTASVQIGFIVGALISSFLGFQDRFNSRKIFVYSSLCGSIINGFLVFAPNAEIGMVLRFLTGITLAGIYPTAIKVLSSWFPKKRGIAVGILIAGLTLGSALPHILVIFFYTVNWRFVIIFSSILALLSSAVMNWLVADKQTSPSTNNVSIRLLKKVWTNKPVMLANYGYFGHMWELYAMWTWIPAFLAVSVIKISPETNLWLGALLSFVVIGFGGAVGSVIGGFLAEKIGKTRLTIFAMMISAICCVLIGFTFNQSVWLTLLIAFIWGVSVIADSAQFSVLVTEYSDLDSVGTALAFQMAIGFLITIFSINLIPLVENVIGWQWVFIILSLGPIFGIISMLKLKNLESREEKQ